MIVAVASGKGGTGKTTVSASLASVWPSPVVAVDLDVEEPNLHLFLNPAISAQEPSYIEIPEIDDEKCTRCRACTDICQYKAIGIFGEVVMTFPEMCHGCGACWTICPEKAISLVSGKAVLDDAKCDLDGICIPACPKGAIGYEEDEFLGGCGF